MEREALRCYRPATPWQLRIHTSNAHELLVRGGKRSSKSTCGFAECTSRLTGIPIKANLQNPTWRHTSEDVELPIKYPISTPKDPRLYWIIGWGLHHIGQTIFRILFQPGLFRVIRDERTGQWRAWNPAYPSDAKRERESMPAEPLVPSRLVDENSWTWDNSAGGKAGDVFRSVRLKNGATICTYPSSAKTPKMGDPVSGLIIDEDIQQPEHLEEFQDRLTDKDGWFIWTVWPHVSNFALVDLLDRADAEAGEENPDIESVQLVMSENPFFTKEQKDRALKRMDDPEKIARRDRGELLLDTVAMYDYIPSYHAIRTEPKQNPDASPQNRRDILERIYQREGRFPDAWTRYLSIDPSHTRTAVLFAAVPPPEVDNMMMHPCIVIENELVMKKASPKILAKAVLELMRERNYEAFIMDRRIGVQTRVGGEHNVFNEYAEAFRQAKCFSRLTRHSFIPGCDRPLERAQAVRDYLAGEAFQPWLYLVEDRLPHTRKEFFTFRKKQQFHGGEMTIFEQAANPRKHDAMAALEYLVAYLKPMFLVGSAYTPLKEYGGAGSEAYKFAQQIKKSSGLLSGRRDTDYVHLGPGSTA